MPKQGELPESGYGQQQEHSIVAENVAALLKENQFLYGDGDDEQVRIPFFL